MTDDTSDTLVIDRELLQSIQTLLHKAGLAIDKNGTATQKPLSKNLMYHAGITFAMLKIEKEKQSSPCAPGEPGALLYIKAIDMRLLKQREHIALLYEQIKHYRRFVINSSRRFNDIEKSIKQMTPFTLSGE